MKQDISSLMDGELDAPASEQAIRHCSSPEGKRTWILYHLIGEAARAEATRGFDISEALMRKIDQEPAIIARPRPARFQSFARIALAAAASVVAVGVVGWIGMQGLPGLAPAQVVASRSASPPAVAAAPGVVPVAQRQAEPQFAALEVRDYLAAHRQMPNPDQYRTVAVQKPAR